MALVTLAACSGGPPRSSAPPATTVGCPWVGSHAPVSERVNQVLDRMTTGEKLAMVHGTGTEPVIAGQGSYAGTTTGVSRLCIPPLHLADGPEGVGDEMQGVTQLPAPVALASTWDPGLAGEYGGVIGAEMRGKGANVALAPTINIVRDPRWGRAFETLGEDPYLTSSLIVPEVDGIQANGVIDEVKHFAVYNQETNRDTAADDVAVDQSTLREIYLPAFEAGVRQAHAGAVMCAYSTVNGAPACANPQLLDQVLKNEWGFGGFVTTDWWADFGGPEAVDDGLDVQMPDGCFLGPALAGAIRSGAVPMSRLDGMVRRILTSMFNAGVIGNGRTGTPATRVTNRDHVRVAEIAAEEGTVLLRNQGVLPIEPGRVHTLAVIGAGADQAYFGSGGGSAAVIPSGTITPLQGIVDRAGSAIRVVHDDGSDPARAAAVARRADLTLVVATRLDSEGHDHTTIDLAGSDNQLIAAVAAASPRTVVVLETGSPVAMPWLDQVQGVVESWYGGQAGGSALAAILFGDVDPSGKLPVTFPSSLADVPAADPSQWPGAGGTVAYDEGLLVGYRWYAARGIAPLFPFGFGLSYTTFSFSHLRVDPVTDNGHIVVSATVTNTGSRGGTEVAQLYLGEPASAGEPPLQLKGFQRIDIGAGRSATVHFSLDASALQHWDTAGNRWVAPAGTYRVMVGDSSEHLPVWVTVQLSRPVVGATNPPPLATPAPAPQPVAARQCPSDVVIPVAAGALTTPITP